MDNFFFSDTHFVSDSAERSEIVQRYWFQDYQTL